MEAELYLKDAAVMRALSHPARIVIVDELTLTGPATATELAQAVEMSPSATSYHLRALAKVGLVEEAPSRGDGRERVWKNTFRGMTLRAEPDASPATLEAESTLAAMFLDKDHARSRAYLARAHTEPREWQDQAMMMLSRLVVTAEELREVNEKIRAITEPYSLTTREDIPENARVVFATYRAFPAAQKPEPGDDRPT